MESLDMTALSWRGKEFNTEVQPRWALLPKPGPSLAWGRVRAPTCCTHVLHTWELLIPAWASILQEKTSSASGDLQIAVTAWEELTFLEKSRGQDRPQLATQIVAARAPRLLTPNPSGSF